MKFLEQTLKGNNFIILKTNMLLTVCSYRATYTFQIESTLYSGCGFESRCSHLNMLFFGRSSKCD